MWSADMSTFHLPQPQALPLDLGKPMEQVVENQSDVECEDSLDSSGESDEPTRGFAGRPRGRGHSADVILRCIRLETCLNKGSELSHVLRNAGVLLGLSPSEVEERLANVNLWQSPFRYATDPRTA